ncbi:GPW/gp25 family protein [Plectonema cf. radiosum LEGE 06105]|uniref:GPW/gp25 family protein n=2 Tax=Plectonema TaxID=1183 RepID=A0A8J7FJN5_9CYAN|nr:GPW/gp25 family protein [Plectonema cf. radiosum LEGE 06105]
MPDPVYGQQQDYLGKGWAFPLQLNVQGGITFSSEDEKVRESIWIILRTSPGERVYRPNFGCRLSELAFAPLNSDTLLQIRMYVTEALEVWEPRITLDYVRAEPDPILGKVDIIVKYKLKDYPDLYSFVYPFYLTSAE